MSGGVHLLAEEKRGSYAARNSGINFAKGRILAFTDSDCIPDSSWLENIASEFEAGADRIAGKICLTYRSRSLSLAEVFEKAFAFDQEYNTAMGVSVTANMAVRASLFRQLGLFDGNTESGGDIEWSARATAENVPIRYADNIVVYHPARYRISDIVKKKNRVLRGKKKIKHPMYDRGILKILITGILPPLNRASRVAQRGNLMPREFLVAVTLLYAMKIYSALYITFLKYFNDR
jgi:glycosyltransferase involved in cell wall biosynthesis